MPDDDLDVLSSRLRRGADGIRPTADVPHVVNAAVARRRRRNTGVAALAVGAVAAISTASIWAGTTLGDEGPGPTDPADTGSTAPDPAPSLTNDASRPAALFQDFVGGRARGDLIQFRQVPGERMFARFAWSPDTSGGTFYLTGVAVEEYDGTAADACAALEPDVSVCEPRGKGAVVSRFDSSATGAVFDRLHRVAPVEADPAAVVRGVTWFRGKGRAVTVVVCACTPNGTPVPGGAPLTYEQLEQVAGDRVWWQAPG